MSTQHTPGPWQANASELAASSALVEIRTAPNGDYKICDCGYQNAHLIAAAPDLLAALFKVTRWTTEEPLNDSARAERAEDRKQAIAAITKATAQ